MMRSLWSAVSGLNTHQLEMDVIGNNISNVNTTAYKSQATGFQDVLYQTLKSGSGAGQNTGAISTSQVGLGSRVSSIYTNISAQCSAVTTNNALDLMITGPSFFVIENGGVNNFTRDGSFTIDAEGFLVTQGNGYYVKGVDGGNVTNAAPDRLQVIKRIPYDTNGDGIIGEGEMADVMEGAPTTAAYFKGNIDSDDPSLKEGKILTFEIYGNDGKPYTLKFKITDGGDDDISTFDLVLSSVLNEDGVKISEKEGEPTRLVYDKHDGRLTSGDFLQITITGEDGENIGDFELDLSNTTNYASSMSGHSSTIYAYKGDVKGLNMGYPEGTLTQISFGVDGTIYGRYSNGQTILKGQLAVAEFNNAMGLEKIGDNLYATSLNSGLPQYMDITVDGGYMSSGVLEGSNVDLAKEFTDMITTQRGFQANSRVITTSDEMLQILKGLKR